MNKAEILLEGVGFATEKDKLRVTLIVERLIKGWEEADRQLTESDIQHISINRELLDRAEAAESVIKRYLDTPSR